MLLSNFYYYTIYATSGKNTNAKPRILFVKQRGKVLIPFVTFHSHA